MLCGLLFLVTVGTLEVCALNNTNATNSTTVAPTGNVTTPLSTTSVSGITTSKPTPTTNGTATLATKSGQTTAKATTMAEKTTSTTKRPCPSTPRGYDENEFSPGEGNFTYMGDSYPIKDKACTNTVACCGGLKKTNLTIMLENCNVTILSIPCGDALAVCKCRAGFLSASVFITLVGMLLYLVPCN